MNKIDLAKNVNWEAYGYFLRMAPKDAKLMAREHMQVAGSAAREIANGETTLTYATTLLIEKCAHIMRARAAGLLH